MREPPARVSAFALPALGRAVAYPPTVLISSSFWYTWLYIAIEHEREARQIYEAGPSGAELGDAIARDTRASLIAIVASAHSIDALQGVAARHVVTEELRATWRRNRTSRRGIVAEVLKRAFGIGPFVTDRDDDFEWLFKLRDDAVHFEEESQPAVAHPLGTNTALESVTYSQPNAARAVSFALDLSEACITSAKPAKAFKSWGARYAPGFDRLRQFREA